MNSLVRYYLNGELNAFSYNCPYGWICTVFKKKGQTFMGRADGPHEISRTFEYFFIKIGMNQEQIKKNTVGKSS